MYLYLIDRMSAHFSWLNQQHFNLESVHLVVDISSNLNNERYVLVLRLRGTGYRFFRAAISQYILSMCETYL